MRPFHVPPLYEALMVAVMTAATLAPWQVFAALAVLAAVILPFSGMGSEKSFTAGGSPLPPWLLLPLIPVAVGIAVLEGVGAGGVFAPLCASNTLCGVFVGFQSGSAPLVEGNAWRGVVLGYIASRVIVYSMLRARYSMKRAGMLGVASSIIVVVSLLPLTFIVTGIREDDGLMRAFLLSSMSMFAYFSFGSLAGFVAYFASLGRR